MIPFNKPYLTGKESAMIDKAFQAGQFSGNGFFTKKCQAFFNKQFGFKHSFLTNSATSALEMAALLLDLSENDEMIIPSYTFVGTATPFALYKAKIVFCDSQEDSPNLDPDKLEELITSKTKALVVMHYGGYSCDMDRIVEIAKKHDLYLIEDVATGITSKYEDEYLGAFGDFTCFSFHETKNVSCGQGGMLVVNNEAFVERAEIIWAKGTNRLQMERGITSKYEWIDLGSNFYPSEITAAFLYAQLLEIDEISEKRSKIWNLYFEELSLLQEAGKVRLPKIKNYQSNNYHLFYLICQDLEERNELIAYLNEHEINAVFHYLPLHKSPYIQSLGQSQSLPNSEKFGERLVRLPLYTDLTNSDQQKVISAVLSFYSSK